MIQLSRRALRPGLRTCASMCAPSQRPRANDPAAELAARASYSFSAAPRSTLALMAFGQVTGMSAALVVPCRRAERYEGGVADQRDTAAHDEGDSMSKIA